MLRVEHRLSGALDNNLIREISELKRHDWPHPLQSHIDWFQRNVDARDNHILAWSEDELVGYTRLVHRDIDAPGTIYTTIGGVSTVVVAPSQRGRGVGRLLINEANALIHGVTGRFGLLRCNASLTAFYAGCGWVAYENPVICREGGERMPFAGGDIAMVFPAAAAAAPRMLIDGGRF